MTFECCESVKDPLAGWLIKIKTYKLIRISFELILSDLSNLFCSELSRCFAAKRPGSCRRLFLLVSKVAGYKLRESYGFIIEMKHII